MAVPWFVLRGVGTVVGGLGCGSLEGEPGDRRSSVVDPDVGVEALRRRVPRVPHDPLEDLRDDPLEGQHRPESDPKAVEVSEPALSIDERDAGA
jgi:hypothetical protein